MLVFLKMFVDALYKNFSINVLCPDGSVFPYILNE